MKISSAKFITIMVCLITATLLPFIANPVRAQCISFTLTMHVSPYISGDVIVNGVTPSSYPYIRNFPSGGRVNLEAVPASGYVFKEWVGNYSGIANPTSFLMVSNRDITAIFSPLGNHNPDSATGLVSILGKLVLVYGYKAGEGVRGWTVYNPAWAATHPEWNTLTMLYRARGYYIKVTEDCILTYNIHSYQLDAGWNLIGWLGW